MKTPQKIKGSIFHAHFEGPFDPQDKSRPYACRVIAQNAEEAIAKVKAVFPAETVSAIFTDRLSGDGPARVEIILL